MVCQTRVRHEDRHDYTKHMLRLRHASQINGAEGERIILLAARWHQRLGRMLAGMFRGICQNGGGGDTSPTCAGSSRVTDHVIEAPTRVLQLIEQVQLAHAMRSPSRSRRRRGRSLRRSALTPK